MHAAPRDEPADTYRPPNTGWRRMWIVCGIASTLLLAVCTIDDTVNRARFARRNAIVRQANAALDVRVEAFRKEDTKHDFEGMTRAEVEATLFPRGAPTTLPSRQTREIIWEDSTRGLQLSFGFRADGTVHGWGMATLQPPLPPPTQLKQLRAKLEPARQWWTGSFRLSAGPVVWMVLVAGVFAWKAARRELSHGALLVAWSCFLGWFLHPGYGGFRGMFSNDMLFYGTLMTVISLAIVGIFARTKILSGCCSQCGYDLTGNVSGVCPECGRPTAIGASVGQR